MDYDIKVHTWWEHRIRKISISSGDNKLSIWFAHFGMLDLEDKKTQNIFAGIMQGIFGEPIETPPPFTWTLSKARRNIPNGCAIHKS